MGIKSFIDKLRNRGKKPSPAAAGTARTAGTTGAAGPTGVTGTTATPGAAGTQPVTGASTTTTAPQATPADAPGQTTTPAAAPSTEASTAGAQPTTTTPAITNYDSGNAPLQTTAGSTATTTAAAVPGQIIPGPGPTAHLDKQQVLATSNTLTIALLNHTTSSLVYAFVTGQAIDQGNRLFLLQADGRTPYYPASPTETGANLTANCAIRLGAPQSQTNITIPHLAGARLWFSVGAPLIFKLNPGPGLVEPSVTNPADPNVRIRWDFCEFTFNSGQLYANITYVDFVSIPIALTLTSADGSIQHVSGMNENGLNQVAEGLIAQTAKDTRRWSSLIIKGPEGGNLRIISPNNGIVENPTWFSLQNGYWYPYVQEAWNKYRSTNLSVNTQASFGTVAGRVGANNLLTFPNGISFSQPSTNDIFSCSTGPFAVTGGEQAAIVPRLAAAFNRSTLLIDNVEPALAADPSQYYQNPITNHYARLVHAANLDGRGYAFPYDDVTPTGGKDQSGFVSSGTPTLWAVGVGGIGAHNP